jgi:GxxExxY protein
MRNECSQTGDRLTWKIIRGAIEVHRHLGPGLLESTYEECLCVELRAAGMNVERQRLIPVFYKGNRLQSCYRLDLIVDATVVVEVKSVDKIAPIHSAQVLTYLKCAKLPRGLIFNFNTAVLSDGIKRISL